MSAPLVPQPLDDYSLRPVVYERRAFCWGAVAVGLAVAIALDIFFMEIGIALNLGFAKSVDGSAIAVADAIAWVITGLAALYVGAWAAGRVATAHTRAEGGLHGLAVWASGAVLMLIVAASSAGAAGMSIFGLAGSGLESAGKIAEVVVPEWDDIEGELTGALAHGDEMELSSAAPVAPAGKGDRLRDRSRMMELAGNHFSVNAQPLSSSERDELVTLMAGQLGIPKDKADRTLAQWDKVWATTAQKYQLAKDEAARAAQQARVVTIAAASWAAFAMILGAVAAFMGGSMGTRCRLEIEGPLVRTRPSTSESARRAAPFEPAV